MTTWGETNHDREADRIYRERLFDPTLEAPFLDTANTHLGRARRCLARARGAAPPSTERTVRALDGRARALAYSEALPEPLRPERSCLGALRSDELLAHIMLFCARGLDDYRDEYTIDNALACTNRMFRRAAASRSVVAAKRRMQHTVFRCQDISGLEELDDALDAMYHDPTEVLELACPKRKYHIQKSLQVNVGPAWRTLFCRSHPPTMKLSHLRVLRLTGFSFTATSWNGSTDMVDSPCLEELEFEFAWPQMQDHLLDSHGHQMHSKAAAFVVSHAVAARAFFQFMDRFTRSYRHRPALRKLVLRNVCLCAVPAPHIARWLRGLPALHELRITSEDCTSPPSSYYTWSVGDDLVRQFLYTFGRHGTIVDVPEEGLPASLPRLETIFLDCGVALGFVDKIIQRAGALTACHLGWQLPPEPPRTIKGQNRRNNIEHRGRGASFMARLFGQQDWLAFCRTVAAHGSLRKLELLVSSSLRGRATLRSAEVLRTAPALESAPMPPPSECAGLAVGRLLATTPRRARVLDLSAYKPTLPRAALETLAKAAPALTKLTLGACTDQEIESVATVFGERLTEFATKGSMDITDGATVALCKYCPRLRTLKLGDSPFLTDATLVLLADKGGLPRLEEFSANSIRFSGKKLQSVHGRNSAHERAYRATYRDATPMESIFSGATGNVGYFWACIYCYNGPEPRNPADVTDPRLVERCYECGAIMCINCAPEEQSQCVTCGVFCCEDCESDRAVLGLRYGSGRERPGPFCKACFPEWSCSSFSIDEARGRLRKPHWH
jgi:hypothetical protein